MKRILLINPFGIGDVLFTTPVLNSILRQGNVSVSYWCNKRIAPLLRSSGIKVACDISRGDLKKSFASSFGCGIKALRSVFFAVKEGKFDSCLDFSLDHRYAMVCALCGIKTRVGFDYKGRGRFLTHKAEIDGYNDKHMVEYYLDLLKPLGIPACIKQLSLSVPDVSIKQAKELLSRLGISPDKKITALVPGGGASWGRDSGLKQLSWQKFALIAKGIKERSGAQVLILGDSQDKPLAQEIIGQSAGAVSADLCGRTDLSQAAALISCVDLMVANDGGLLHTAVALGKPTVSIYGPVNEDVYGPYPKSEKHIVVKSGVSCRPCYRNFRLAQGSCDRSCLESIDPESVISASLQLLR